jgi:hypothetical protein
MVWGYRACTILFLTDDWTDAQVGWLRFIQKSSESRIYSSPYDPMLYINWVNGSLGTIWMCLFDGHWGNNSSVACSTHLIAISASSKKVSLGDFINRLLKRYRMNKNSHNRYEIRKSKTRLETMASYIKLESPPLKFWFNMCRGAPEAIVMYPELHRSWKVSIHALTTITWRTWLQLMLSDGTSYFCRSHWSNLAGQVTSELLEVNLK